MSKQAEKFLKSMDDKTKQRIIKAIKNIPQGDISPYKAIKGYYRLRTGNHRVLYEWVSNEQILVAVVEFRGNVYKKGV